MGKSFISDFIAAMKRENDRGRCLHFFDGKQCGKIIAAHSIQRRGQLGLIAEDGHIYRANADFSTLQRSGGAPQLKKIGIGKASIFDGFCSTHDNSLFEPIDNYPLTKDRKQIALYAYRSLCREYFVKENAVRSLSKIKDHPEIGDHGLFLDAVIKGQNLGWSGLQHHKRIFDQALSNCQYQDFEFTYFTSKSPCSIQVSGLFYPDFDFRGNRLQNLGNWSTPLALITFFTAPLEDGWAFGIAWHKSSNAVCKPFERSIAESFREGKRLEDLMLRFAVSCCENHAIRISWWDQLSDASKQVLLDRIMLMGHPSIPVHPMYLASGCEGIADWIFDYVATSIEHDAAS
ncbi:hypothetical protein [Pseudomonas sp. BF-R-26]|uniref:hypothetical protein n=1 Tax=Pseudomonas sp. BF-R-26 TaxID=2832398 RepID=UPI001CBD77DE|nr:hypothetical protein [Pseudomonas sp. BF-R-26]